MSGYSEQQLQEVFAVFDTDKSGQIDCKELLTCLLNLGKSEEDAKAIAGKILIDCDTDSDRKITWDEFKAGLA